MISLCCHCEFTFNFHLGWETVTACSTFLLALFTFFILIEAKRQLKKVKEFIGKYTSAVEKNAIFSQVQSAENIILKQIDFHYRILDGIKKSSPNESDVFIFMYEERLKKVYSLDTGIYNEDNEGIAEKSSAAYKQLFKDYGYLLGHFYRNLYRIFKKIDETNIVGFDKNHYAKLVRAQLSEYEILLLFYNCIWVGDGNKFKKLIERYELLEGMNYEKLLERGHYVLYEVTAYGNDFY